ncbi:MAG: DUF3592 domain-containing protein [Gammaproteobacteria bacterium]|nr:DUF3592 domain-containing protein [Gammaproteobacteria bacterium]
MGQPWHSLSLALVGIILSTVSFYGYLSESAFIDSAIETKGIVTDNIHKNDMYYPVIQFRDKNNKWYVLPLNRSSSSPMYEKDETVTVLYSPTNPDDAKLDGFFSLWLLTFITGILGFLFSLSSILLWIYRHPFYAWIGYPELSGSKKIEE